MRGIGTKSRPKTAVTCAKNDRHECRNKDSESRDGIYVLISGAMGELFYFYSPIAIKLALPPAAAVFTLTTCSSAKRSR